MPKDQYEEYIDTRDKFQKSSSGLNKHLQASVNKRFDGLYFRVMSKEDFEADESHYDEQITFVVTTENGSITKIQLFKGDIEISGEGGGFINIHNAVRFNIGQQYEGSETSSSPVIAKVGEWTENVDFVARTGYEWANLLWQQQNTADNPNLFEIDESHTSWSAAKTSGAGIFLYPTAEGRLQRGYIVKSGVDNYNGGNGEDDGRHFLNINITREGSNVVETLSYSLIFGYGWDVSGSSGLSRRQVIYIYCERSSNGTVIESDYWTVGRLTQRFTKTQSQLFPQFRGSQTVLTIESSSESIAQGTPDILGLVISSTSETEDDVLNTCYRSNNDTISSVSESSAEGERLGLYYSLTDGSQLAKPYIHGMTADLIAIAQILGSEYVEVNQ